MSEKDRETIVHKLKVQLILNNFGLPEAYDDMSFAQAQKEFRAIRELAVRMNLYVSTGNYDKGIIDFPEARRRINYELNGKHPKNCKLNLIALMKR